MEQEKLSRFTRLRLKWVGINLEVIAKCPEEIDKYLQNATTILITATLACFSGGYAMYAISGNAIVACFFGPFWGFVIFNLDSSIISGMRKPLIPMKSETLIHEESNVHEEKRLERLAVKRKELKAKQWNMFLVRALVAIVLGLIISLPLEALIFRGKIESYWNNERRKSSIDKLNESLRNVTTHTEKSKAIKEDSKAERQSVFSDDANMKSLQQRHVQLQNELAKANEDLDLQRRYVGETKTVVDSVSGITAQVPTERAKGALYRIGTINSQIRRINRDLNDNSLAIVLRNDKLDIAADSVAKKSNDIINILDTVLGGQIKVSNEGMNDINTETLDLIKQLEVLGVLRADSPAIFWANMLIMIVFVLIEIAPVAVKFFTPRGTYDELLEIYEKRKIAAARFELHDKFSAMSSEIELKKASDAIELKSKIDVHRSSMEELAGNRMRIIKAVIDKTEKQQLKQIDNNKSE